jgi:hypothetical protein
MERPRKKTKFVLGPNRKVQRKKSQERKYNFFRAKKLIFSLSFILVFSMFLLCRRG